MSVGCSCGFKSMHLHFEVLRHLAHHSSKRRLANKQIDVLLVLSANGSTRQHEGACGINVSQHLISLSAHVPGRYRCGFLTPPVMGALLRATFVTGIFFGARPPVDLLAVCLVLRQRQRAETEGASGSLAQEITLPFLLQWLRRCPFMH